MANVSRLYRTLDTVTKPIFELRIEDRNDILSDDQIMSISIKRGGGTGATGVNPSTCEIRTTGSRTITSGSHVTVRLSTTAAAQIAGRTSTSGVAIASRFVGRIGTQEVSHKHTHFETRYAAASWTALLSDAPQEYTLPAGRTVMNLIATVMKPPHLASRIGVTVDGANVNVLHGDVVGKYSDLIGSYCADIGYLVQHRRSGNAFIRTLAAREDAAAAAAATVYAIEPRHVLDGVTWLQPQERYPAAYRCEYRDSAGVVKSLTTGDANAVERKLLDWKNIRFGDDGYRYIYGLKSQTTDYIYRIFDLEIDLLMLWKRGSASDLALLGQLLNLEESDPVGLGINWPSPLRGMFFADGITEEITPDSWRIKLELTPYSYLKGNPTVIPRGRTWDSRSGTWNTTPGTWDQQ